MHKTNLKIETKFDPINRCLYHRCEGIINDDNLLNSIDQIIDKIEFKKNMNYIWDFKNAKLDITIESLQEVYPFISENIHKMGNKRTVAIIANKLDQPLIGVYIALSTLEKIPAKIGICDDFYEAQHWVKFNQELL